ncbi:MAG: class I SAM-dependent RNA methyltransferase [Verrucomicrobiota bacterium]
MEEVKTKPPACGSIHRVRIVDTAFGGEGVARLNEFVVFVPFVITGEEVEIEITEVKKQFARARLRKVLTPSPERVQPECRYFGECGGCQYQHIRYETQLRIKHKQIADLFQRVGGFAETVIAPVVPCPNPYGYRNRIMIRSQWNKPAQKLNIGFLRNDNNWVVDLDECKIAEPVLSEQIKQVRANPPPKGGIKVVLRVAPEGWHVPRDSFFQNNFFLLPKLVEVVRERLRLAGTRHLIDAYCGVGFFGIELGDLVESFAGVEIDTQAVKAARRNAAEHGRTNGEFILGATEELLPQLLERFSAGATSVVIDPPRVGCEKAGLELLRQVRPAQIIYVSCHPATLARDLNILCAGGVYKLTQVVPLDMFPQTQHVECVADLRAQPAIDTAA